MFWRAHHRRCTATTCTVLILTTSRPSLHLMIISAGKFPNYILTNEFKIAGKLLESNLPLGRKRSHLHSTTCGLTLKSCEKLSGKGMKNTKLQRQRQRQQMVQVHPLQTISRDIWQDVRQILNLSIGLDPMGSL